MISLYSSAGITNDTFSTKLGMAQMLRGGVVVEVTSIGEAKVAEVAGACCVVVSGPRKKEMSRMADPSLIGEIKKYLKIPVMAKVTVGHFAEAQILESIGLKYIDESEITGIAAYENNFINKHNFEASFVCGCRDLGEALRRITEGSAMIRIQGSGNIVETMASVRKLMDEIGVLSNMAENEVLAFSKRINAPYNIVAQTKQMGRLPVAQFAAGGIMNPADAALMMQLGCDGVFVGVEIWNCLDPFARIGGIVHGVKNYNDPTEFGAC